MLIQLLVQHPQVLPTVLKGTPAWAWAIAVALAALGASQLRTRTISMQRALLMPIAMTVFSIWGMWTAFGSSPMFLAVMATWAIAVGVVLAAFGAMQPPAGARFDAMARTFTVHGSVLPLALIVGIFLVKYVVGVDVAMQPGLIGNGEYVLVVAAIYGAFSGIFTGRAVRLWRLVSPAPAFA